MTCINPMEHGKQKVWQVYRKYKCGNKKPLKYNLQDKVEREYISSISQANS